VIGAHGTGDRPRLRRGRGSVDFARAIIARAERPILLVPMQAA
jgi:hypothetical protein